jgi:hypothetical protein
LRRAAARQAAITFSKRSRSPGAFSWKGQSAILAQGDRNLKGSPQSGIVDACDVVFENGCSLRLIERGNRLGMADASGLSDDSAG